MGVGSAHLWRRAGLALVDLRFMESRGGMPSRVCEEENKNDRSRLAPVPPDTMVLGRAYPWSPFRYDAAS